MEIEGEVIHEARKVMPSTGSAGLQTQLLGQPTTVDGIASATGGIGNGTIIMKQ